MFNLMKYLFISIAFFCVSAYAFSNVIVVDTYGNDLGGWPDYVPGKIKRYEEFYLVCTVAPGGDWLTVSCTHKAGQCVIYNVHIGQLPPDQARPASTSSSYAGKCQLLGHQTIQEGIEFTIAKAQEVCYAEIDNYRRSAGLPGLRQARSNLEDCASAAAKTSYTTKTGHAGKNACQEDAQNECPGWKEGYSGDPITVVKTCLKQMWDEGPGEDYNKHGHYINMTDNYSIVACGFYIAPDGGVTIEQNYYR